MKKAFVIGLFTMLLLVGCSVNKEQQNVNIDRNVSDKEIIAIADNLKIPWSIETFEDTFYLSERPGNIVKIKNGEVDRQDVEFKKELATASEAGLLGFVLAPNFQESKLAYAYYTYEDSSGQFNRIVTLRHEDSIWKEYTLLLDKIPSGTYHHGGRLEMGPDGKLYATVGDASQPAIAQELESLGGKILRMNLDGSIPSDNPFSSSYVYSYGHRNPQGVTWSSDGTFYASEHGNSAHDEINKVEAGHNYGWPIIQGLEKQKAMVKPIFTSGNNETWAPSGMDYYDGKLYVAALRGTAVLEFDLAKGEQKEIVTRFGRIRDILIKDDFLYFISNNTDGRGNPQENDDKLYRVLLE